MKIYVWEGNGISDAYHDDGTLVVLAESPEQAREVVREAVAERERHEEAWSTERDALAQRLGLAMWATPEGKELMARSYLYKSQLFDGSDSALDREPDRIVEIDKPTWVAFNGGGYD